MSFHINAKPGEVAETVLLPGDPLRAKHIAETMLEQVTCYNHVRNMYGFTGYYQGKRVSIQGTGMGIPSIAIYASELISSFQARRLIRVGSCGAIQPELQLRDIILAMAASTDSSFNKVRFGGMDYAPTASFRLLKNAYDAAMRKGIAIKAGNILSSDNFYNANPEQWKLWAAYGVLAIEMESTALYTLAAQHQVEALSILTVSDSLVTGEEEPAAAREKAFTQMFAIALELAE
ncbi:MAG: Purine nucleoside phosphorylase DeoD-type [bacterium]|nr:Purine nucleoside phosphorylase DeoD-type [bacterium]